MRRLERGFFAAIVAVMIYTSVGNALGASAVSTVSAHAPQRLSSGQLARPLESTVARRPALAVSPLAVAGSQGGGNLAYGGGPVQASPKVYLIFWGTEWGTTGSPSANALLVKKYFQDAGPSYFANVLTQYSNIANAASLAGAYVDPAAPPTDTTCGGATVQDSGIQGEVSAAIAAAGWAKDGTNALYLVFTPSGTSVNNGAGACSEQLFCSYHKWSASVGVAYAAIPFPSGGACQVKSSPNNNVTGDSLVNLASSMQFGGATDPQPGGGGAPTFPQPGSGWVDGTGLEISQKCAWNFAGGTTYFDSSGGTSSAADVFQLQTEYSNAQNGCTNDYAAHMYITPTAINAAATTAGASPPNQILTVQNTGLASLNWHISSQVPAWLTLSPSSGTVAPGASQQVTLSFAMPQSTQSQTYSTDLVLSDPASDTPYYHVPVTVVSGNLSQHWYFAEGFTGRGFDTKILLANPNPTHAHITITYHLSAAPTTVQHIGIDMAPYGRFTDDVNNFLIGNASTATNNGGRGYGVAAEVDSSDAPIVAERVMYFNGDTVGFDVMGATHLGHSFYFDYLDNTPGHMTLFTILNSSATATMYARVTLYSAATNAAFSGLITVPANARGAGDVSSYAPPGLYSGVITLSSDQAGTQPLDGLVERPMYWNNPKTGFYTGEDVIGAFAPNTSWNFAEGWTHLGGSGQGQFHETLYLANPTSQNLAANAAVTIFREDGGAPVTVNVTLSADQQKAVDINAALPPDNRAGNSIRVTSDNPILAERLMTWDYGATDLMGTRQTANAAYFAESYIGPAFGGFTEILTLENPNPVPAQLTITYLFANDLNPSSVPPPITMMWTVPANARSGFPVNSYLPHDGNHDGFSVQIVASQPILAERVMYFNGGQAGTDAAGYQGEP